MKPVNELLNLSGQTAVVTGGSMGIGKAIAMRLHEAGANVAIADVADEEANALAAELNINRPESSMAVHVDVANPADVTSVFTSAIGKFGKIDILVNNAGIYPSKTLAEMGAKDLIDVLNVNLAGAFLCLKEASEQMKKQGNGGKIINITSIDALHPSMVGLAHYDASKHGLWGLTKNAALELAEHKIWVNAVAPGGIATPGVAKMNQPSSADDNQASAVEAFMKKIPMHRMGDPDEIGKVVLFLASDMSSYMTGAQIVVDGGVLLS